MEHESHGVSRPVLTVALFLLAACAPNGEPPRNYEAYLIADDGTPNGRTQRIETRDSPAPRASVTYLDRRAFVEQLASRGASLSPSPTDGRAPFPDSAQRVREKDLVIQHARAKRPDERVRVVLELEEFAFPEAPHFHELDPEQRQLIIEDRKEALAKEQREIVEFLESLGAVVHETIGAFNEVRVEIPAGLVEEVLEREDVKAVHPSWQVAVPLYDLDEAREATFISEFWDLGIQGQYGSRSYSPRDGAYLTQKLAVIEPTQYQFIFGLVTNNVDTDRSGWIDHPSGSTRLRGSLDCTGVSGMGACLSQPDGGGAHATWVTSVLAGSILDGQDPNIITMEERKRRTGMVPEGSIYFFNGAYPDEIAAAIFGAVGRGADVINLSLGLPCGPTTECSPTANCGGINNMIRFATDDSHVLVVAAAGNSSGPCPNQAVPSCRVCYPARRPEVLAVGNVNSASMIVPLDYNDADIHQYSSRGWVRVGVAGPEAAQYLNGVDIPAVSIAAPGVLSHMFLGPDGGYRDSSEGAGTSFASPIVAGGAALIRQEMGYGNPFHSDVRMLRARVLAMGDGTGAGFMSETWGAGRVKFHPFDSMVAPKGSGEHRFTLHHGQLVTLNASHWPASLPSEVTQWKMGVDMKWTDLSAIPYVTFTYRDVCGGDRVLAVDSAAGLERHMVLDSTSFDSETCIVIDIYGLSVPPVGVEISAFEYYHSGDPTEH